MRNKVYAAAFLTSAIFLAGCEGDDGVDGIDGSDGSDGFNSLIAIREIPKGDADCLGGGTAVDSGLDTNRNDILDESEVTSTTIVECEATPTVRALHASPDAPAVNIWVNGTEALSGVDYAQGSGFVPVVEENNIQVEAIIPGGNAVVIDEDVSFDYSTETTVIAVDTVADNAIPGPIRALTITNPTDERLAPGYFRAQVVHASPSAPPVDVYVTALDADLNASMPVNMMPLEFETYTERLEVPAGDYQIRVTLAGEPDEVVFDSGEIALAEGADLMIVAVEYTGPGEMPVQLVVLDGTASSMLYDANTPGAVSALHLSPDAPAVDLLADITDTPENEAIPLVRDVAFKDFCRLDSIPSSEPGGYEISVVANSDNSIVATSFPLGLNPGDEKLRIVSGFLSSGTPELTTILVPDSDTRSVVTETKLRITHASPSTPAVDLYLVPAGTDINTVDPSFEDVAFGVDTSQLSIAPGMYDAIVTAADSKTPAISLTGLDFTGGEVLDVIARDPDDSETLPQAVVIDYSSIPACPAPGV